MGDMKEVFEVMKQEKKEKHRNNKDKNTDILFKSAIPYESVNGGETLLFRQKGKPKVNFYPSTGRWTAYPENKTFNGEANSFLKWYAKQE